MGEGGFKHVRSYLQFEMEILKFAWHCRYQSKSIFNQEKKGPPFKPKLVFTLPPPGSISKCVWPPQEKDHSSFCILWVAFSIYSHWDQVAVFSCEWRCLGNIFVAHISSPSFRYPSCRKTRSHDCTIYVTRPPTASHSQGHNHIYYYYYFNQNLDTDNFFQDAAHEPLLPS